MTIAASTPVYHSSPAAAPHKADFMDQNVISVDVLQRNVRVLNQKEDRNLQQKLNMLEKQYRHAHKMLQQRRDSLARERRRVMLVKVCEPKATANIAMKEIGEQQRAGVHLRASQTSGGRRFFSSRCHSEGAKQREPGRSTSAPLPPPVKPASPVRRRGHVQSGVSLMQMKSIANIDSISEKERARRRREAREETERTRELQRETLQKKVTAFMEMLKGESTVYRESPYRNTTGDD